WLRDVNFFYDSITGRSADVKSAVEDLTDLIKRGLPPETFLVITAAKVDRRSAFAKACQNHGQMEEHSIPEQSNKAREQAVVKATGFFQRFGLKVPAPVMACFIEKAGYDTRQILNEVEKLYLYMGERKEVREEDIAAIVSSSRETEAWDFADAVAEGRLPEALAILRQLLFQGESDIGLIISLERRYKELLILRECLERKWLTISGQSPWLKVAWEGGAEIDEALSVLPKDPRKTNPFRTGRLVAQARGASRERLILCQQMTMATHEQMVSSRMASDLLLENLVIRLLGRKKAP
ncbi:MAG: hypothetical protein V2A34_10970, partial [Lentisphaerota bacterium]